MATLTELKLDYLKGTKDAIRAALIEKGQAVSATDTFRSYADKVLAIEAGSAAGCVTVTFMSGDTELLSRPVYIGDDCPDPVEQERIETPTKESTAQYDYTHNGWATADGGTTDSTALLNVTEDKILYATFAESVRMYAVNFYDGETLVHTEQVAYGGSSEYEYQKSGYAFMGWSPVPIGITEDMDCYGTWVESAEIGDSWDAIIASVNDGTYKTKYGVGQYKPLDLGSEGIVNMQIVAMDTDTDSNGATIGTTWIAKELLTTKRAMHSATSTYAYESLDLCAWLNSDLKALMPVSVQSAIKATTKQYRYRSSATNSEMSNTNNAFSVWLPSKYEVGVQQSDNEIGTYNPSYATIYNNDEARQKCIVGSEAATDWWLRDVFQPGRNWLVVSGGTRSSTSHTNTRGVCIGFCI